MLLSTGAWQALSRAGGGPLVSDAVHVFAVVMAVLLAAPALMQRARLPGSIGVILAGALIGPSGLHVLDRAGTIEFLGTVGLMYLMYTAGLSLDLHQFAQTRRRSVTFGALSFFVPQILGILAGLYLLGFGLASALLLGSITGSHTLLAYPVAKRLGITRNRAVTMAIGGTIFTDALALSLLAVVVATANGDPSALFWARFLLLNGLFLAAVVWGLPAAGRWFFRKAGGRGEVEFLFLMVVLFAAASASRFAGLAPIVGAFLAGLSMNRLVPDTGPLMNRIHFVGDALFVPFFLLSVGMLVDPRVLSSAEVWLVAGVFTTAVAVGKLAAAKAVERLFGLRSDEGWTVFGLTVPQAAATLAVTLVGYGLGLFDVTVVNAVVVMILLTCVAGPWLVERYGRRVALEEETGPLEPGRAPLRILVPLANPASAPALMDLAFMIRRPDSPEPVHPLTVVEEAADVAAALARGEKMLGYAVVHASAADVPVVPVTRIDLTIAGGIGRAVRELRISTVVIGWTGAPSARRRTLGTVLDQILHENAQTVIVCKFGSAINTTERVVLVLPRYVDREPSFAEAVRTIKLMASKLAARLVLVVLEADAARLEPIVGLIRPAVPLSLVPLAHPSGLVPALREHVQPHDMLLVLSPREGRPAWTLDLGRLPRLLVESFPEHNLVLFFPSEVAADPAWLAPIALPTQGLLDPARVTLALPALDVEAALERILAPAFPHKPVARREVIFELARVAREYSTEIAPGLALLHAHVRHVLRPTFFLATSREGIEVPRTSAPVGVMLVLLSPRDVAPEAHLRALGAIAKMVRSPDLALSLRSAASYEELAALLAEGATEE